MSLPIDASWPAAGLGDSLGDTLAEAWLRVRARARADAVPRYLALRVRVPDLDPLDWFARSPARERFFWSHPDAGIERAVEGGVWSCSIRAGAGGDRFEAAGTAVAELLERLEVIGDPAPPAAGPIVHAGFAFADRGAADPGGVWAAFPAAHLVLAERQIARTEAGTFECRLVRVTPEAPDDGWADLFAPQPTCTRSGRRTAGNPPDSRHGGVTPAHEDTHGRARAEAGDETEAGPAYTVRAHRPHAHYEAAVAAALDEIAAGGFEKVVLARALDVTHDGEFGVRQFIDQLRGAYPSCATFVFARGDELFVSASPERLVALDGDLIRTGALAGSAPRGQTPEADAKLGRELIGSAKNLAEHEAVRRAIVSVLRREARAVHAADVPALRRLAGIQHLETPIEARLVADGGRPGESLLRLVSALHPTPAVGGLPAEAADAWIEAHESLDRGWYAAPVGWIGADGSGEFRVALRSALLRRAVSGEGGVRSSARLFAGAGIVTGSEPHAELVETRIKLRALLAPLTEI
jgi:isochorismate synthase